MLHIAKQHMLSMMYGERAVKTACSSAVVLNLVNYTHSLQETCFAPPRTQLT